MLVTKGKIVWRCSPSIAQLTGWRLSLLLQGELRCLWSLCDRTSGSRHPVCSDFCVRGSGCSVWRCAFYATGSNYPFPCFLFLICFRTWRSESAWGGFCEWTATPGCSPPKDSGTCSSRCQALRHLQAASGQPWLCQQNPRQVKAGAPGFHWFLK